MCTCVWLKFDEAMLIQGAHLEKKKSTGAIFRKLKIRILRLYLYHVT